MGFAIPGVIGAQLADSFPRAIALVGDGAFQMIGMELLTAKRLGLNPTVIVVNLSININYFSLISSIYFVFPICDRLRLTQEVYLCCI